MRRLLVSALVLAGCSGPQQVGAQPSWRSQPSQDSPSSGAPPGATAPVPISAQAVGVTVSPASSPVPPAGASASAPASAMPLSLRPADKPASHYNEPLEPLPRSPLNDAALAVMRDAAEQAHAEAPVADPRLFRACAELAAIVPEQGVIDYALSAFAFQHNGVIDPSPRMLVAWGPLDTLKPTFDSMRPLLGEMLGEGSSTRFGIGIARRAADGSGAVVVALEDAELSTAPIPRRIAGNGNTTIDAVLDAQFHDAEVLVTYDDGSTAPLALQPGRPHGFKARLACDGHNGREQVEIAAAGKTGSTVLANFPVWCGAAPPASITITPVADPPAATAGEAEQGLLTRINRDRASAGLPALVWDDQLAGVARKYSTEMQHTRVVAHVSPTSGSVVDRIRAANIRTGLVLENLAHAYSVGQAHQGLMNSPGHRANILSPNANRVGIGVAFGDPAADGRELFVTEVFSRVAPKIDVEQAFVTVRDKLVAVRPELRPEPALRAIAQQLAESLATGTATIDAQHAARALLEQDAAAYAGVAIVISAITDVGAIDAADLLGKSKGQLVGIGIAQGTHPELGDNAVWIALLIATPRTHS